MQKFSILNKQKQTRIYFDLDFKRVLTQRCDSFACIYIYIYVYNQIIYKYKSSIIMRKTTSAQTRTDMCSWGFSAAIKLSSRI